MAVSTNTMINTRRATDIGGRDTFCSMAPTAALMALLHQHIINTGTTP